MLGVGRIHRRGGACGHEDFDRLMPVTEAAMVERIELRQDRPEAPHARRQREAVDMGRRTRRKTLGPALVQSPRLAANP